MTETKILKAALDAAESKLLDAREDRTLVKEAAQTIKGKIVDADKAYLEALTAVWTLARGVFQDAVVSQSVVCVQRGARIRLAIRTFGHALKSSFCW